MIWRLASILSILLVAYIGTLVFKQNNELLELKSEIDSLKNTETAKPQIKNRVIRPKFLGTVVDGNIYRCDSMYPPAIPFEGKYYDMRAGYAIAKTDSGRLINENGKRFVVYPNDKRYYKGHEDGKY